jgi:hypothetical protein
MRRFLLTAALCCGALVSGTSVRASLIPPVPLGSDALWNGTTGQLYSSTESLESSNYVGSVLTTSYSRGLTAGIVVELLEPGSKAVSDYVFALGSSLVFASDVNGPLPGLNSGGGISVVILTETGGWQDVSRYFGLAPGSALVASDVSSTPLPATLPLMGGVLGAGCCIAMWRRRRGNRFTVASP